MSPQTKRLVFIESFLGNFLFSICMLFGVSMTSALNAGIIMSTIPAVVAVLSWIFLRERIGLNVWLAVACGVLGIALFAISKSATEIQNANVNITATNTTFTSAWLGNVLLFCAVLCEAAYAVIGKKLTNTLSPKRISALINLWGFVLMTPFGLYMAWQFNFGSVSNQMWLLLILCTGCQCVDCVVVDDRLANYSVVTSWCVHGFLACIGRRSWRACVR